jgi:hypothetical protein
VAQPYFDPDADAALTRLENDPNRRRLLAAVSGVLDQLEADPGHWRVRRIRFSNGLWCVTVVADDDEWALLWEPHSQDPDGFVVHYLGPASFS